MARSIALLYRNVFFFLTSSARTHKNASTFFYSVVMMPTGHFYFVFLIGKKERKSPEQKKRHRYAVWLGALLASDGGWRIPFVRFLFDAGLSLVGSLFSSFFFTKIAPEALVSIARDNKTKGGSEDKIDIKSLSLPR
nr:hypothetical protein [Pandoravirus aubagnensis]